MTPEEARAELERLDSKLPELAHAADMAGLAVQRAQARADEMDEGQWYGRRTGQLRAALEELESAQHEHERVMAALGTNHHERARLQAMLQHGERKEPNGSLQTL